MKKSDLILTKCWDGMGSEALVKRFAVKFLEDKSFEELTWNP